MPFDLFHGNPSGSGNAECGTRCNHIIVGTLRMWETINPDAGTINWTARCAAADLTKNTLGNRSYINQLHYAPGDQTLAIVGTNDGNVWTAYGMGGIAGAGASCVNVTGGNSVRPNRPILDVTFDPTSNNTAANPMIGYAAVGGFSANTPATPGHVYRVVCDVNCANFTWQDKSGTLPDIPVDSIIANPNNPIQVFAGTDFGLYYTNDITAASPNWFRFKNGLPSSMVWGLSIDRGNTTLGVWTRSRGAYAWALPTAAFKIDQTISFGPLAGKTFGDPDFVLDATASSGLPVSYASSGNCTVSGTTVHITGGGSCSITASQPGNLDYNAAPDVVQSFVIEKAEQTIDFTAISDKTWGDTDFTLSALSSAGLAVSFSAAGDCTVSGNTVHITGAGSCTVTASQPGDDNYKPATPVDRPFTINKAEQTIEFATLDDKTFGDADFEITATSSAGLTVALAIDEGHCTLDSATSPAHVHISGASPPPCSITASQGGNANYKPAPPQTRTFAINRANQTIDFGPLADKTWGDSDFDVSATATSNQPVSFAATGDCTASGNTIHITGAGECTVTALQGGSDDYNPAPDVARTFTIHPSEQTIDFAPLADKVYLDADIPLSALATSGLPVAFATSGNCVLVDSNVHITGAGSCTVTASQGGNANYKPAPSVSRTFAIAKADQTISFAPLADKTYTDPDFDVAGTATSGLPVAFALAGDCVFVQGKVSITAAGSCTVTASQSGDDNYNAAPSVARTFTIHKSDQTIEFAPIGGATFGNSDFEIDATASSHLSVGLAATGPCTVSSPFAPANVHITGAGSCTITASQGGNGNYNAAPNVARSFTIARAPQTITFAPLPDRTWGDPDFTVSATASSHLPVAFAADGGCTVTGTTVHVTHVGICTITASQGGNVDYLAAPSVSRGFNVAWVFTGFSQPIDNGVTNVANAGQAIPVKFALAGNQGLAIFAAGYPQSAKMSCTSGTPEDAVEETSTAGSSSLSYSSTGYNYVWKTDKAWAGTCRMLSVKFIDNTTHVALFRFK
jgi:hypothetical protein